MKKYESVLKRVRFLEEKNGIKYAKTDGALYRVLKVLYIIVFAFTSGVNLLYVASTYLRYSKTEDYKYFYNQMVFVLVCLIVMIVGFVFFFTKYKIVSCIINLPTCVGLIIVYKKALADTFGWFGENLRFYWCHLLPLALIILFSIWLTVISERARFKTDKMYKRVTENLYKMYNVNPEDKNQPIFSDEQWNQFLENFDPRDYKKQFFEEKENENSH